MRSRGLVLAASIAALILTTSGCAPVEPQREPSPTGTSSSQEEVEIRERELLDVAGFVDEYQSGVDALRDSLPEGATFPTEPADAFDTDAAFETGYGAISAAFVWQCAWLVEYEVARTDSASKQALDRLESWIDLPEVRPNVDDETHAAWATEVIAPAREGNDEFLLTLAEACSSAPAE